jgi:putative hydrolase of the HAD superfamily
VDAYDAVLFDLDGTLCRSTGDTTAAYRTAFEAIDSDPFGAPSELWERLDGPPDPDDHVGYIATGFARLAAVYDRQVPPLELSEAFLAALDDRAVEFTPGAEQALALASAAGSTGLVTNGPRDRQEPKVDALGLGERLDTVVYAGDLDRRKPHAAPFDRALAALDVTPDRAVYVGNSLEYDVAGAFTAGIDAVWLRPAPDREPLGYSPAWTLDSLTEFEAVVDPATQSDDSA